MLVEIHCFFLADGKKWTTADWGGGGAVLSYKVASQCYILFQVRGTEAEAALENLLRNRAIRVADVSFVCVSLAELPVAPLPVVAAEPPTLTPPPATRHSTGIHF